MNPEQIGKFIAELRKEKEMTQAQLGEKLGVTNKTISRWENGNYMPDISLMQSLCVELEISINEFLSGERLNDQDFRKKADTNIIFSLKREKLIQREKKMSDFLCGAGTGILVSTLYSPDSIRRSIVIMIGIIMICIGWYRRSKYDRYITQKKTVD